MTRNLVASIGLISDTHFQERSFELPPGLADLWADVDLILHAGDVGHLEVLDQLGASAPVIAVHGNDEPEYVQQALPYQQLLTLHRLRVLLWHSHYPDPIEEKANRSGTWGHKLTRIAGFGREVQANFVVYGHTHVPLITWHRDVLLVNPGALASGSYFTRQLIRSVACLKVMADGTYEVTHFDVETGQARVFAAVDQTEQFEQVASQYEAWMVEPDLVPDISSLRQLQYENLRAVVQALIPVYKRRLIDGLISRADIIEAIRLNCSITDKDRASMLAVLDRKEQDAVAQQMLPGDAPTER
jgi:putative phosphoesterase